jgi:hypothetical protein
METVMHASITILATPEQIFNIYADVAAWPDWDADVSGADLDGPFRHGATGWLKPAKGPKAQITISELSPEHSFTAASRLPLCKMHVWHQVDPMESGCRVTHGVRFEGPLAWLFRRVIGRKMAHGFPAALRGLKERAEQNG